MAPQSLPLLLATAAVRCAALSRWGRSAGRITAHAAPDARPTPVLTADPCIAAGRPACRVRVLL
jgi:hypothetical protein